MHVDVHSFAGSSVLVTGGAGFVGSNLVRSVLDGDVAAVHVVDNLLSAERTSVPDDPRVRFTEDSIASDGVLQDLRDDYDYVFHLSTYHGNQSSIHNPLADHEHNQLTTLKLFERLKDFRRLRKVVYAGAGCAVADKTFDQAHATLEDAPISLQMDSPYSISKIVGEFYAVYYHRQHGLPAVRARFQNIYGPGEILGAGQWRGTPATVWRNVVPTFVYKALKGEALPVEAEGSATRDFIYVDDIVRGLLSCASNGASGDVYNLASGTETSILDLATLVNELTGNVTPLQFMPGREWDRSGKRFGSTAKARRELGFEARVAVRDGLIPTIDWTQQHLSQIDSCIERHSAQMSAALAR
jgi:UDP-glucose 4-epimerase